MSAVRSTSTSAPERKIPARTLRRVRQPAVGAAITRANPAWEKPYQRRLVATDSLLLAGTLAGTQAVWIGIDSRHVISAPTHGFNQVPYWLASLVLLAAWLVVLKAMGTRSPQVIGSGFAEYARIADGSFRLFGLVGIASLLLQFLPARGYIITAFPVGVLLLVASRWCWRQWLRAQRRKGRYLIRVLLVGSPSSVEHLHEEFSRRKYLGFEIVGACLPIANGRRALPVPSTSARSRTSPMSPGARGCTPSVLAGSEDLPPDEVRRIGWRLESTGVDLMVAPAITEVAGTRIHTRPVPRHAADVRRVPVVRGRQEVREDGARLRSSRALALVLVSPLMLATAIGVKVTSPGPVLFRQQRIGLNGKAFDVYQVPVDAGGCRRGAGRAAPVAGHGRQAAVQGRRRSRGSPGSARSSASSRSTSCRSFFNVIRGEMSLVGPRPAAGGGGRALRQRGRTASAGQARHHRALAGERAQRPLLGGHRPARPLLRGELVVARRLRDPAVDREDGAAVEGRAIGSRGGRIAAARPTRASRASPGESARPSRSPSAILAGFSG